MILIEEDDEKVGEDESCSEPNEEAAHKENKNINNKGQRMKEDSLQKPRAL